MSRLVGELLPFDLRGRRVLQYRLRERSDSRAAEKERLTSQLEVALPAALSLANSWNRGSSGTEPRWWGSWRLPGDHRARSGALFIREVGHAGFLFHLIVTNGAHNGTIGGFAEFAGPYLAYARLSTQQGEYCELSFRKDAADPRMIVLDEAGECFYFRGMGATFAGDYVRQSDSLFDCGCLDELDLARLYGITGQFYEDLCNRFQQVSEIENNDLFPAKVFNGGVRGLYGIMEGIVMRGEYGQLWVAYVDGDVLRYFTTERKYKEKLPNTMEPGANGLARKH